MTTLWDTFKKTVLENTTGEGVTAEDDPTQDASLLSVLRGILSVLRGDSAGVSGQKFDIVAQTLNRLTSKLELDDGTGTYGEIERLDDAMKVRGGANLQSGLTITGDGTEQTTEHDVTGQSTAFAVVTVPAGATASYKVEQCAQSGQSDGQEIDSATLTAGQDNYIPLAHFDGVALLFKFISDQNLTLSIASH